MVLNEIQADQDALNLYKYFKKIDNVIFLAYYTDILKPLFELSKAMQKKDLTFQSMSLEIARTMNILEELR